MNCPLCSHASSVVDSRPIASSIRRRRKCDFCGHRWNTFEVDEAKFKLTENVSLVLAEIAADA